VKDAFARHRRERIALEARTQLEGERAAAIRVARQAEPDHRQALVPAVIEARVDAADFELRLEQRRDAAAIAHTGAAVDQCGAAPTSSWL
jgi:hypothetical protein